MSPEVHKQIGDLQPSYSSEDDFTDQTSVPRLRKVNQVPSSPETNPLDLGVLEDFSVAPATAPLTRILTGAAEYENADLDIGDGRPFPPLLGSRDPYRVEFSGPNDPLIARNWPLRDKIQTSGVLVYSTLVLSWGSGVYAPTLPFVEQEFHVAHVVAALGIALYVLGFAMGPLVWGPLSELYGRKLPMVVSFFIFVCFTFASATAKDLQTLMICRFMAGSSGAAPFSVVAACFADMFAPEQRGVVLSLYNIVLMGGPMISPIVGSYICASYLNWRWTLYLTGIMAAFAWLLQLFLQKETYGPCILKGKAHELRRRTNNWAIFAELEIQELSFRALVEKNFLRPLKMLSTEPILTAVALYNGFVYGLLYMTLEALPIIFTGFGFKGGNVMLPYLAIFIGCILAAMFNIFVLDPRFNRKLAESGEALIPEERLVLMKFGAVTFAAGIFWLCWAGAYPDKVHWILPCIGGAFYGFGFLALYIPLSSYTIDSYPRFAASALAGIAFVRGGAGSAFPLVTTPMFNNLGIQWAGTLIGCLATLMMPIPFLFYRYGAKLRNNSQWQ